MGNVGSQRTSPRCRARDSSRTDLGEALDALHERVFDRLPHPPCERHELPRRQRLAVKEDHQVVEERAADLGHRLVGKRPGESTPWISAPSAPAMRRTSIVRYVLIGPGEYSAGLGYFGASACAASGTVHPPPSARKRSAVAARCWRSASARFSSVSSSCRSASIAVSWLSSPAS
jgi:hypothetical protein